MANSTHDTQTEMQDKAVLVSLITDEVKRSGINTEYSLDELVKLAETAGVEVLSVLTQNKEAKDSKWFIGKGKVEELRAVAEELGANTAIFDQELSGAQVRNLEESLDLKIIDRTQLILDIFAQRAKTREGIIQVELAQLSYLLPVCLDMAKTSRVLAAESEHVVLVKASWRQTAVIFVTESVI